MTDEVQSHPEPIASQAATTAAFTAFPLAVLCLFGTSLLSGSTYVHVFFNGLENGQVSLKAYQLTAALVSAAIAAIPLVLSRRALSRLSPADPWWVGPLLRATSLLALLAIMLKVISGLLSLAHGSYPFGDVIQMTWHS